MNEPKFTPGPWIVCPDIVHQIPVASVAMEGLKLNVAHVAGIRNGEGTANAHLIAAAPDLYSALKMVLDDPYVLDGRPRTYKYVQTALAKARGEG